MNDRLNRTLLLLLLMLSQLVWAASNEDQRGSSDHPLVDRYPGSYINRYTYTEYDLYELPTGPTASKKERPPIKELEGGITTIIYRAPKTLSTLQIFRNYEKAFADAGYKPLYSCTVANCGEYFPRQWVKGTTREGQYNGIDVYNMSPKSDYRFWTGVLRKDGKEFYTTLLVRKNSAVVDYLIEVLEVAALETGKVGINLDSLGNDLEMTGKAVLEGIYFDTGKATLKAESGATLAVIAQYLKREGSAKVFVVGHTDYTGGYDLNVDLSKRRAAAVIVALGERGVATSRMTDVGVGPVAPAASNADESGRSTNRRVELVLRNSD